MPKPGPQNPVTRPPWRIALDGRQLERQRSRRKEPVPSVFQQELIKDHLFVGDGSGMRPVLEEVTVPQRAKDKPKWTPPENMGGPWVETTPSLVHTVTNVDPNQDMETSFFGHPINQDIPTIQLPQDPQNSYASHGNGNLAMNYDDTPHGNDNLAMNYNDDVFGVGDHGNLSSDEDDSASSAYCNCEDCIREFQINGTLPSRVPHNLEDTEDDLDSDEPSPDMFVKVGKQMEGFFSKFLGAPSAPAKPQEDIRLKPVKAKRKRRDNDTHSELSDDGESQLTSVSNSDILLQRLSKRQQQSQYLSEAEKWKRAPAGSGAPAQLAGNGHYEPLYLQNCSANDLESFIDLLGQSKTSSSSPPAQPQTTGLNNNLTPGPSQNSYSAPVEVHGSLNTNVATSTPNIPR